MKITEFDGPFSSRVWWNRTGYRPVPASADRTEERLDVEKKKMLELCRKMRKLGLQHMCDIKGEASIKVDSEVRGLRVMKTPWKDEEGWKWWMMEEKLLERILEELDI